MKTILLFALLTTAYAEEPTKADIEKLKADVQKLRKPDHTASLPADIQVPDGWKPAKPVVPPEALKATDISKNWLGASTPVEGRDGKVMFVYGAGLPVIVCAPLRISVVELEPGERITADLAIGDAVRWDVTPRVSGEGPTQTILVVIKPRAADIETNIVISTNRRAYYLRLISDPSRYVARAGFEYPDQPSAEWKAQVELQQANARAIDATKSTIAPLDGNVADANFGYDVKTKKGADPSMTPLRVFDLAGHTHIVMPATLKDRAAPVLLIHDDATKKDEQCNFRMVGDTYIVDRLFDHAVLVLGVGKNAARVDIVKQKG